MALVILLSFLLNLERVWGHGLPHAGEPSASLPLNLSPPPCRQPVLMTVASPPWRDPALAVEDRVKDLLGRMSTEDKIIQLDARQQPTGAVDRLGINAFQGWNGKNSCYSTCYYPDSPVLPKFIILLQSNRKSSTEHE